jgi:hypothetical protein
MNTEEKHVYRYIPEIITRQWSSDVGNVDYIELNDDTLYSTPTAEAFTTDIAWDLSPDALDNTDVFGNESFTSVISSLAAGDSSLSGRPDYWTIMLLLSEFYSNPFSFGRYDSILSESMKGVKNTRENVEKVSEEVKRKLSEKMTASELITLRRNAVFAVPYLFDLTPVILSAAEGDSFILSADPLLLFNPLFPGRTNSIETPFHSNGTVLMMPLTPQRMLCLYDRNVYKLMSGVLSHEDTVLFNRITFLSSPVSVVRDFENADKSWMNGKGNPYLMTNDYIPSVFGIRARSVEMERDGVRPYCAALSQFDTLYFTRSLERTPAKEALEKRIDYAVSLLSR